MNLEQAISGIRVGEAAVYGGLAVFPLIGGNPGKRDYLTLTEAFKEKGVTVSEVSEGGTVPELRLKNMLLMLLKSTDLSILMLINSVKIGSEDVKTMKMLVNYDN